MADDLDDKLAQADELYKIRENMSAFKGNTTILDKIIRDCLDPKATIISREVLDRARVLIEARSIIRRDTDLIDYAITRAFEENTSVIEEIRLSQARKILVLREKMVKDGINTITIDQALGSLFKSPASAPSASAALVPSSPEFTLPSNPQLPRRCSESYLPATPSSIDLTGPPSHGMLTLDKQQEQQQGDVDFERSPGAAKATLEGLSPISNRSLATSLKRKTPTVGVGKPRKRNIGTPSKDQLADLWVRPLMSIRSRGVFYDVTKGISTLDLVFDEVSESFTVNLNKKLVEVGKMQFRFTPLDSEKAKRTKCGSKIHLAKVRIWNWAHFEFSESLDLGFANVSDTDEFLAKCNTYSRVPLEIVDISTIKLLFEKRIGEESDRLIDEQSKALKAEKVSP